MSGKDISSVVFKGIDRFGVSVVLLFVFIYLAHQFAIAVHHTIVEPMVTANIRFLEKLTEQIDNQTDAMSEQARAFRSLSESHEEQVAIMRRAFSDGGRAVGAPPPQPVGHP